METQDPRSGWTHRDYYYATWRRECNGKQEGREYHGMQNITRVLLFWLDTQCEQ